MTTGGLNDVVSKSRNNGGGVVSSPALDDGSGRYGEPLVPLLNDRLAYDEPYTTDASTHQYRIWSAQLEYDNARRGKFTIVDSAMKRFGATQWDTHEGYFVSINSKIPI